MVSRISTEHEAEERVVEAEEDKDEEEEEEEEDDDDDEDEEDGDVDDDEEDEEEDNEGGVVIGVDVGEEAIGDEDGRGGGEEDEAGNRLAV